VIGSVSFDWVVLLDNCTFSEGVEGGAVITGGCGEFRLFSASCGDLGCFGMKDLLDLTLCSAILTLFSATKGLGGIVVGTLGSS
jgi:hypothetical protein